MGHHQNHEDVHRSTDRRLCRGDRFYADIAALFSSGVLKAMVVVETAMNRPVGNSRSHGRLSVVLLRVSLARFRVEVLEVEMPLANRGGVVTPLFQETRDCGTVGRDQARCETLYHSTLQSCPPAVSPRHQAISRRRTDRRTGMRIFHLRCTCRRSTSMVVTTVTSRHAPRVWRPGGVFGHAGRVWSYPVREPPPSSRACK